MPVQLDKEAAQSSWAANNPQTGYGLPSAPTASFDVPNFPPEAHESIFHPVKAMTDIICALDRLFEQLSLLNKENARQRTFKDVPVQIGGAQLNYPLDYQERKYLYVLSGSAITLLPSTGGTLALTANIWQNISLPRGTTLLVQGGSDAAPATVWIRACDFSLQ